MQPHFFFIHPLLEKRWAGLVKNLIYKPAYQSTLNIRRYTPGDLTTISIIERKAFGAAAYSRRLLKHILEDPHSVSFIAEDREKILGYICAIPISRGVADIESIAVEPRNQSTGVGSLLFDELEQELTRAGYTEIVLEVRESNSNAIEFYKKRGFKISEYLPLYYKLPIDGTRNAYRMVKYLDL